MGLVFGYWATSLLFREINRHLGFSQARDSLARVKWDLISTLGALKYSIIS